MNFYDNIVKPKQLKPMGVMDPKEEMEHLEKMEAMVMTESKDRLVGKEEMVEMGEHPVMLLFQA